MRSHEISRCLTLSHAQVMDADYYAREVVFRQFKELGVSRATLYRYFDYIGVTSKPFFPREEVEDLLLFRQCLTLCGLVDPAIIQFQKKKKEKSHAYTPSNP